MKSEGETELEHRSETSDTFEHAVYMFSPRLCDTLVANHLSLLLIIIIYVRSTPVKMKKNIV